MSRPSTRRRQPPPRRRKRGRGRGTILLTAFTIIALGLLAFAVTGFMMHYGRNPADAQAQAGGVIPAGPESYQSWPSPKELAPIADRKDDDKPLTKDELFAERSIEHGSSRLELVDSRVGSDCGAAVQGGTLAQELKRAGCTQAGLGLYRTKKGRLVAQFAVFNLRSQADAERIVGALKDAYRGSWAIPLDEQALSGHSEGSGYALGHYAALVWCGRGDGASPAKSDDLVSLALSARAPERAIFARAVQAGDRK